MGIPPLLQKWVWNPSQLSQADHTLGMDKKSEGQLDNHLQTMGHLRLDPGFFGGGRGFRTIINAWNIHTCVAMLQIEKPTEAMTVAWSDEEGG